MKWPPRSPVLTPRDFFLWGYVKEQVFVPPLPLDIDEVKLRITAGIATIYRNMLEREWDDVTYILDICRVTSGAHIQHFYDSFFSVSWGGVRLSQLDTSATNWPIAPAPDGR
jgi:hypothetical protein